MSDQLSIPSAVPLSVPSRTMKLWTPTTIGVLTFVLGFPGGLTLAVINWIRMGLVRKAIAHVLAGLVGTAIFAAASLLVPGDLSRLLSGLLNLGVLGYLVSQMRGDIEPLRESTLTVQNAHWFAALLIALLALGLWLAMLFVIGIFFAIILTLAGIPIPE